MILSETSSRKPSRIGFWIVLGLGGLLLPLAPRAAGTEAPEEPQRTAVDRDRADKIENLQDEIELLKVRVRLKEARIDATKKRLEEYQRRLENYKQICQRQPGTIPTDTLMETHLHVTTHEGNLQINKAELEESQMRLKQAQRRLARLQRPSEKTDDRGRAQQEKRLRELEQKVDKLLKEIHNLRKEMQPDKPSLRRSASDKEKH